MARRSGDERSSRAVKESGRYRKEIRAFGLRVRQLRHEHGWTLEYASERTGVDLKHLQKIEAGQINVTFVTLVRLAAGLKVELAELFVSGE
ncbi:MAG: helix-turn-helix transcriptional regulator [Proteobacteria bacterium]|nr:helix-turn-helix transcriptional regulator [Pseudomonadota bacterium]